MATQTTQAKDPNRIMLKRVRLSYPSIFKATAMKGEPPEKAVFSASFILDKDKHADLIKTIKEAAERVIAEKWGKTRPKGIKVGLRDGAEKADTDGYGESIMFLGARDKQKPEVIDAVKSNDGTFPRLTEADGRPYAGCYVNATVRIWAQDNQFGKRVNFGLGNIQFAAHGEPFGEGRVAADSEFDEEEQEHNPLLD